MTATMFPPCDASALSVLDDIFALGCNGGTCHGEGTPAWDLLLVASDFEQRVVNVHAVSCPGWLLVTPGSPEQSFLFRKLSSDRPPCGERMPLSGSPLPPDSLACVRGWIESLRLDAASADVANADVVSADVANTDGGRADALDEP